MIGKKEETVGFLLLVRPPRRRNPARDARALRFALSGENPNRALAPRRRTFPARWGGHPRFTLPGEYPKGQTPADKNRPVFHYFTLDKARFIR